MTQTQLSFGRSLSGESLDQGMEVQTHTCQSQADALETVTAGPIKTTFFGLSVQIFSIKHQKSGDIGASLQQAFDNWKYKFLYLNQGISKLFQRVYMEIEKRKKQIPNNTLHMHNTSVLQ